MNEALLEVLLKITGSGLILLVLAHIPISRYLQWNSDARKLMPENEAIFHSHAFFICLGVLLVGVSLVFGTGAFLEKSVLGKWVSGSLLIFWLFRLVRQWTAFPWSLWQGKRMETMLHFFITVVWLFVVGVFGSLWRWQMGF